MVSFAVRGTYFESCNCEAICPCRMVGGVPGGRSTYGVCHGALSWEIEEGRIGEVEVDGLMAVLVISYDDDEPGSPWTIVLHVDERGDARQRQALEDLFLGRLGGPHVRLLPWIRKESKLVAVRPSRIELEPDGRGYRLLVADAVELRATKPVETDQPVSCGISGYERIGTELYAEEFDVRDDPFAWELAGNCAFATDFAYASE
jgi:hypothetical protein